MTSRARFLAVLNFEKPADRCPMIEWAPWWNATLARWESEGLDTSDPEAVFRDFGLDRIVCIHARARAPGCPAADYHGGPLIADEADYERLKADHLYNDAALQHAIDAAAAVRERHERGDLIVRLWLDGYFWFPRALLGIEPHFLAFYDKPDLIHRINADLTDYNRRAVKAVFEVLTPDMVGFAEDLSYNHGPMLSRDAFEQFLTPYYRAIIPRIRERDVHVLVDSDGDITTVIPWMQAAGIEGVYPLERQAGVDVPAIRAAHPDFLMMGGFDKIVMNRGEAAIRTEFERLLPVIRSGGFVPSVDHQTPPGVSLADYRLYLRLFAEYARRAVAE